MAVKPKFYDRPSINFNYQWFLCGWGDLVGDTIHDVPPGTTLKCHARIREEGGTSGVAFLRVYIDDVFKSRVIKNIAANEIISLDTTITMPSNGGAVSFKCGNLDPPYDVIQDTKCCITLKPPTITKGSISVKTNPPGANVYLDDRYRGTSPITISDVSIGTHLIEITLSGFGKVDKQVIVKAGETTIVDVALEPTIVYCDQTFKAVDENTGVGIGYAGVNVPGVDKRTTNTSGYISFRLVKGKSYSFTVTKSGYSDASGSFTACVPEKVVRLKSLVIERIDTEIAYFDVRDIAGVSQRTLYVGHTYSFNAFLYEAKVLGHGAPIPGRKIDIIRTDTNKTLWTCGTQPDGGLVCSHTIKEEHVGEYKLQAKLRGDEQYNESASAKLDIVVTKAPERGVNVVVRNVPGAGLNVLLTTYNPYLKRCEWVLRTETITIYTDLESAMFALDPEKKIFDLVCIQVKNMAGALMGEKKNVSVPKTGTVTVHMDGWNGCKYRARLSVTPSYPKPGDPFTLQARLVVNPETPAGENMDVQFYEIVNDTRTQVGAPRRTDEKGIAYLTQTKAEEGKYTYEAEYAYEDTFCESIPVTVTEKPPECPISISALEKCPIMTALQGTVIFTHLDTLRWYRDFHMHPALVKTYYWLIPVTGRIARCSRIARIVVRAISAFCIHKIEKRYGSVIPYLQQANV